MVDQLYRDIAERSGRSYTRNDVVNFLTCATQGYITVFAGQPGTGKTSLCALIAGALGLTSQGRYTEIGVEHGWTSYKDYIGYYNPLSQTCEKANDVVYDAFAQLDAETRSGRPASELAPWAFLLDEANLSPIEHYWSPFLGACDTFSRSGASIHMGGAEQLRVPPYVRFLATVNYDHTTEALSSRFLDRSWVIRLDATTAGLDLEGELDTPPTDEQGAFSYAKLLEVFGPQEGAELDQATRELFESLKQTCARNAFPLSPRAQGMIVRYASVAGRLMDTGVKDSRYAPLDYAGAQKLLPRINGSAGQCRRLLEDLKTDFGQLPITQGIVSRMMAMGDDIGYYQFFA